MVSQDNRVLGPSPRELAAEPSTSVTPVDTSSQQSLGTYVHTSPSPSQSNRSNIISGSSTRSRSKATFIPKLSESTINLLASIRDSPQEFRTKADPGRTWIDSPPPFVNGNSVWNLNSTTRDRPISASNAMTVLRNRTIAPRPLAPVPPHQHAAAPVVNASIEAPRASPSILPQQPRPAFPSLISITPKSDSSQVEKKYIANEPALPSSAPLTIATTSAGQLTPVKPIVRNNTVRSGKRAKRRRRPRTSDDEIKAGDSSSDESSDDMAPTARQTKSGRQVNRPTYFAPTPEFKQSPKPRTSLSENSPASGAIKRRRKIYRKNGKDLNITCKHCQRGHSPSTNMIVFCDECNVAWHQFCHDPPIGKELIDVKEAEWFCRECRPLPLNRVALVKLKLPRRKTSTTLPDSPPRPLVGGEKFTVEQQRGYLTSLSHTALVEMLVKLSERNPTIPIFPENLSDLGKSKYTMSPLSTTVPQRESQQLPSADISTIPTKEQESKPETTNSEQPRKHGRKRDRGDDSDESSSEYEVEEHRLYPRPGNGFRLPPEEDDIDMLLDDPACPTFSHTLHDYAKGNVLAKSSLAITAAG